jgi:hypothetical protein
LARLAKRLPLAFCLIFLCAVFAYTVHVRQPTFAKFPASGDNLWRQLSNGALMMAKNWQHAGPAESKWLMNFRPVSVELTPRISPYISYPPFFVALPYALHKLTGIKITLGLLMALSLLFHAALVLLVFFLLYFFLGGNGESGPLFFATLGGFLAATLPPAVLYYQNAWWADVAVLPFFVALILLDQGASRWKEKSWFEPLRYAVVIAGVCTDWLFYVLLGFLFLKNISARPRQILWKQYLAPAALYLALHLALVANAGLIPALSTKIQQRTGILAEHLGWELGTRFWLYRFRTEFGLTGLAFYLLLFALQPLLWAAFFFRHRFGQKSRELLELTCVAAGPLFLHSLILHQHYYEHTYNLLKFILLFALVPTAAYAIWWQTSGISARKKWAAFTFAAILTGAYASTFPRIYESFYAAPFNLPAGMQKRCEAVEQNTSYEDILFSPDFFSYVHPQLVEKMLPNPLGDWGFVACYKTIYLALSPREARYHLAVWRNLENKKFRASLLLPGDKPPPLQWRPFLRENTRRKIEDLTLVEISVPELVKKIPVEF